MIRTVVIFDVLDDKFVGGLVGLVQLIYCGNILFGARCALGMHVAVLSVGIMFMRYFYRAMHYSAKRGIESACRLSVRPSVCPSVTLANQDHISWKSWKLIARTISPTS